MTPLFYLEPHLSINSATPTILLTISNGLTNIHFVFKQNLMALTVNKLFQRFTYTQHSIYSITHTYTVIPYLCSPKDHVLAPVMRMTAHHYKARALNSSRQNLFPLPAIGVQRKRMPSLVPAESPASAINTKLSCANNQSSSSFERHFLHPTTTTLQIVQQANHANCKYLFACITFSCLSYSQTPTNCSSHSISIHCMQHC